jgi:LacI family transcriptional regulator
VTAARRGVVTIIDVARHAGVAPSTVSYVLSGKRVISAPTRQRVQDSIRSLGYHPHAGARSMASHRSSVIALVMPLRAGVQVPVVWRFAGAVVTTARVHRHDVLLVTADEGVGGLRRVAASAMVDGLIVMDVELRDPRVALLRKLERPSVLIGFPADAQRLTCVDLDFYQAGTACVDHLARLGHKEIAFLGAPRAVYERGTGFAHRTTVGFREAAAAQGLRSVVVPGPDAPDAVAGQVVDLFHQRPKLTGLVVHNEAAVNHVLAALRGLGRHVPNDVSVVAICPDEVAEQAEPALDSVLIPAEEVGARAVELLMRKIEGGTAPASTLLAPQLTVRASTAAPARRRALAPVPAAARSAV